MAEYAKAVLSCQKNKAVFIINFAIKITQECDCLAKDDPRIVEDISVFASDDPVAIDKACYDAVVKKAGKDIFKDAHPGRDGGMLQLRHSAELGLGEMKYRPVLCREP